MANTTHGDVPMNSIEWLTLIVLCLIVILTILGNLLIILVILIKQRLRSNVTNRLIGSLAAADLLLGVVVMPFAVVDQLRYIHLSYIPIETQSDFDVWIFGQEWCDLWHAFDVLSSTASILNLCVISLERYIAISDPFNYPTRMTHSKSICMIFTVWICSAFISFPAIIWWRFTDIQQNKTSNSGDIGCECIFSKDTLYLLLSSAISFYIPLIVMVVVYCRIYRTARKLLRTFTTGQKFIQHKSLSGDAIILRVHRGGTCKHKSTVSSRDLKLSNTAALTFGSIRSRHVPPEFSRRTHPNGNTVITPEPNSDQCEYLFHAPEHQNVQLVGWTGRPHEPDVTSSCHNSLWRYGDPTNLDLAIPNRNPISDFRKRFRRFVKDRKAAKTLGIVMGVFILCWLPFFVYNTVKAIYPMVLMSLDYIIFPLVTWLGYINSTINPFVYAFSLKDFQKALSDLISKPLRSRRTNCHVSDVREIRRRHINQTYAEHVRPCDSLHFDTLDKPSISRKSSPKNFSDYTNPENELSFVTRT